MTVLAGGGTTLRVLAGPTAGYIVGYVFSPAIPGVIAYRVPRHRVGRLNVFVLAALGGPSIQYVFRALGLIVRSGLGVVEAIVSQLAFIPAVSIEMTVCIIIALGVHAALPELMRRKPQIFTSNSNEEATVNS